METEEILEALYDSHRDDEPVSRVVTENDEFEGVTVTRTEIMNSQLEVLVGDDASDEVVQFDVKFSVDGSLMSISMFHGDPRESVGIVERVEQ